MKKLLSLVFLLPFAISLSFSKNTCKTQQNYYKSPEFALVSRSSKISEFLTYWNEDFRPANPSVCDITLEAYKEMYAKYQELDKDDIQVLNETQDILEPDYTIGQIIKTLVQKFYPNNKKVAANKKKLDQSVIIVIAVVVALVGASAISVLFILKNEKVIK